MSKSYDTLIFNKQDNLVTITLNRPDAANGMSPQLTAELADAAVNCSLDADVKAVILTGAGKFFSAGGDIKAMQGFNDQIGIGIKGIADDLHKAISIFARMNAPLIVAVNGTSAGAGFSLAIAGDIVIASEFAKFTMAYSKIGLSPDGGSSYYLPRLIGLRKTQELMFTNRVLSAGEAEQWGLVNKVVENSELLPEAKKMADMCTTGALQSNSTIKKLLLSSFDNGLETQMEIEGQTIARNANSIDGREGVKAFVEKRKPVFK